MTKDLDKFYNEYTDIKDGQITIYEDEKGNHTILPTTALLLSVDYNELNKQQYDIAVFNQDIPKDFISNIIKIKKAVSKFDITHKEEDKFTLTEKEEAVHQVWFVMNQLKIKKAFNNKDEAIKYAKKINNKVLKALKEVK